MLFQYPAALLATAWIKLGTTLTRSPLHHSTKHTSTYRVVLHCPEPSQLLRKYLRKRDPSRPQPL